MAAIDPLTAGAVFLATAGTDAVYVMFTSAVVHRKRVPAATWSSIWYARRPAGWRRAGVANVVASAVKTAPHTRLSSSAQAEDPVHRGFSILSSASLEYWITRMRG